jgi:ABC-type Fe3+ transport system permease subunit
VKILCLLVWAVVIAGPFVAVAPLMSGGAGVIDSGRVVLLTVKTFVLAGGIACVAVVLGFFAGRVWGWSGRRRFAVLLPIIVAVVLPRYVLFYCWSLLFDPGSALGGMLTGGGRTAGYVWTGISAGVLAGWYWPIAALIIGQGYRNIDREIVESASLDAGAWGAFWHVRLGMLRVPVVLAFCVCFVMGLSEFATFHLAGVDTVGTELAVLYEMTGVERFPAGIALPMFGIAIVTAGLLGRSVSGWSSAGAGGGHNERAGAFCAAVFAVLVAVSVVMPVGILLVRMKGTEEFGRFVRLHPGELGWSLLTAFVAAVLCEIVAAGAMSVPSKGRWSYAGVLVRGSVLAAMLSPASVMAVGMLKMWSFAGAGSVRENWLIVSMGHAMRFSGVALIFGLLSRSSQRRQLAEAARVDGASEMMIFRKVHWPGVWMTVVGSFLLIMMLSMTELSATMVLLPAGVGNFAQRLLNQMHYARDQQVIASCLILIGTFVVLCTAVVGLIRMAGPRRAVVMLVMPLVLMGIVGCDGDSGQAREAKVAGIMGRTGRGEGEFLYPRAIDISAEGDIFVVDKTGRIQRFDREGEFVREFDMPLVEAGKPTGMSLGPDPSTSSLRLRSGRSGQGGRLYVADTHYHRVVVFDQGGRMVDEWGSFGKDDGCFIYPTDVAFAGRGDAERIFVSEYGGNDRISVFDNKGGWLFSFGSWGSGEGEFSRPSAMCVDEGRGRLYVADACNHRIAVYDLEGNIKMYFGEAGTGKGQLGYPYDLALMPGGDIIVCEFGNNRLQLFGADGVSKGVYGRCGRKAGELAYPWGVAVDDRGRVLVVDAGNNRVQIWQL